MIGNRETTTTTTSLEYKTTSQPHQSLSLNYKVSAKVPWIIFHYLVRMKKSTMFSDPTIRYPLIHCAKCRQFERKTSQGSLDSGVKSTQSSRRWSKFSNYLQSFSLGMVRIFRAFEIWMLSIKALSLHSIYYYKSRWLFFTFFVFHFHQSSLFAPLHIL